MKPIRDNICCGIILYNPDIDLLKENVNLIIGQVASLLLIDNNSSNWNLIERLISEHDCDYDNITIIRNSENKGIAEALNQILKFAEKNGYEWYLTLDQDSRCSKQLIEQYTVAFENLDKCDQEKTAILCPFILNNGKIAFSEYEDMDLPIISNINQPTECITSGALCNVNLSYNVNGYMTELFIDCVDFEFNTKLLLNGYKIFRANKAYLFQVMGAGKPVPFFKFLYKLTGNNFIRGLQVTPIYSHFRLYYLARNSKYLRKKYGKLAGKRVSFLWTTALFLYYFLTYPISYGRLKMIQSIRKGLCDSSKLFYFRKNLLLK